MGIEKAQSGLSSQGTKGLNSIQLPSFERKLPELKDWKAGIDVNFMSHNICVDLQEKAGPSSQINFYKHDKNARQDNNIIPMFHGWKTKQVSQMRFGSTQE